MRLSTVFELEEKICATRDELARLKSLATAITPRLDGLPKAKSLTSRVEALAVKILDCERRLAELVEEKICAQVDLTLEISERLQGDAATVLTLRYANCKTFAEIARAMSLSRPRISVLHKQGLSFFSKAVTLSGKIR